MPRPPLDSGVVVVTGASSGIGRELATQLAADAKALVLVARRAERLEELAAGLTAAHQGLEVLVAPCDLTSGGDRARLLDDIDRRFGEVDVLINNAGFGDGGLFERSDPDKTSRMLALNITALTELTRALLPPMVARRSGGVLNISSGLGLQPMPGFAAYAGTKHYVTGFTESLRIELAGTGVVVSQVCPGPVMTEFQEVAGGFDVVKIPGWLAIDARTCARSALRQFRRGKPLIYPGAANRVLMIMGAFTPRWFLRLMFRPMARQLRKAGDGPSKVTN